MKKIHAKILSLLTALSVATPARLFAAGLGEAQDIADTAARGAGLNVETSVTGIVATIIFTTLTIVGILFMILLIYSGVRWMTAGGNEHTIKTQKQNIKNAIIGIIIIMTAYSISYFIITTIESARP